MLRAVSSTRLARCASARCEEAVSSRVLSRLTCRWCSQRVRCDFIINLPTAKRSGPKSHRHFSPAPVRWSSKLVKQTCRLGLGMSANDPADVPVGGFDVRLFGWAEGLRRVGLDACATPIW